MRTEKKLSHLSRFIGKGIILGALALTVAGCVAEPYPGYYRSYPDDYSYYNYSEPPGPVILDDRDYRDPYYHQDHDYRDHDDHDDPRFNGRRGNGNYHGSNDDAPHDD